MKQQQALQRSFSHAWRGLRLAFRTERSFRIQLFFGVAVFAFMWILPLSHSERLVILLAMASVFVLELLNSAVERLADILKPRLDQYVADVKDLMAAAVLIASFFAVLMGLLILGPHLETFLASL